MEAYAAVVEIEDSARSALSRSGWSDAVVQQRFVMRVKGLKQFSQHPTSPTDSPAPCKVFPKAPKIALTIDDIPQSEYQRRKSSGSSVNSNHSAIEPHIYDFQEKSDEFDRNTESTLVIRFAFSSRLVAQFVLIMSSLFFIIDHKEFHPTPTFHLAMFRKSSRAPPTALSTALHVCSTVSRWWISARRDEHLGIKGERCSRKLAWKSMNIKVSDSSNGVGLKVTSSEN